MPDHSRYRLLVRKIILPSLAKTLLIPIPPLALLFHALFFRHYCISFLRYHNCNPIDIKMQEPKPTNKGRFSCGGYLWDLPPPLHGLPIPLRGMLPQAARQPVRGSQKTDAQTLYRRRQTGRQAMHQYRLLAYLYRQKLKPYGRQKKADSGCKADKRRSADRHKKQPRRIVFYRLQAVCILSLHPIQGRQGRQGREGSGQKTEAGQIADAAGIVRHPGRHKNALQDRFCFAVSVCSARLCFGLSV